MQLYSSPISPYAARCRIQILHKQLPVEIVPPPGGMRSADVLAKNPVGKIPVLDLGDTALAESWSIMEYLEARFPQPPMRPADALAAAQQSALVRFVDIQLAPAMFPLFRALRGGVSPEAVAEALTQMDTQLAVLDALLARRPASSFDLADAALLPVIWYGRVLVRHFGQRDLLAGAPAVQAWWARASAVPAAATVLAEMENGLRAMLPQLFAAAA